MVDYTILLVTAILAVVSSMAFFCLFIYLNSMANMSSRMATGGILKTITSDDFAQEDLRTVSKKMLHWKKIYNKSLILSSLYFLLLLVLYLVAARYLDIYIFLIVHLLANAAMFYLFAANANRGLIKDNF